MLSTAARFRNFLAVDDNDAVHVWILGGLALVAFFVLFLLNSSLTAVPFFAFVGVAGYGWIRHQEETAKGLTFLTTIVTVTTLGLIIVFLVYESLPAFRIMGIEILTRTEPPLWKFGNNPTFSLLPMVWGTFVTTIVAMSVAGPLGIAGALFIGEMAPGWARELVKPGVEILAGIPSIVYGFIGFTIVNRYMYDQMGVPTFGSFVSVGLVIGVMALPTVVSVAEDALESVPDPMRDGALAMGATDWQTMKSVTIPAAFSGVSAAVLLGVGRAMGETMAATVMLAHTKLIPEPLYDVFANTETLTSVIAFEYGNAGPVQLDALFASGVVLFVTVLFLSVGSQLIEDRMEKKLGGKE